RDFHVTGVQTCALPILESVSLFIECSSKERKCSWPRHAWSRRLQLVCRHHVFGVSSDREEHSAAGSRVRAMSQRTVFAGHVAARLDFKRTESFVVCDRSQDRRWLGSANSASGY